MGDDDIDVNLLNSRLKLMQRLLASYGFHFTEVVEINDKNTRDQTKSSTLILKKKEIYINIQKNLSPA